MTPFTITSAKTHDVRFPTSDTLGGSDAMNKTPDYSASYLVLETDLPDLAGHGFTFTIGRGSDIVTAMVTELARPLVGRSVVDMVEFMESVLAETTQHSQIRWLGPEKGVTHLAAAAVLNAVWDMWARIEGVPLWQLLSDLEPEDLVRCLSMRHLADALTRDEAIQMLRDGKVGQEDRIAELREHGYPGYVTSAGWLGYSDEKVTRLVTEGLAEGWSAFKMKVGGNLKDDQRRLRLVRDLIGEDMPLMADANQVWEVPEAIEWMKALEDVDLYWIEEPTSPDDVLGHKAIADAVAPVRVATGEHAQNRIIFKQLLMAGAISVCQIDSCRVASVNENIPILLMAHKFGVPVCPHAGGVGLCELVQHLAMFDYIGISGSLDGRWIEYVEHLHEMFVDPIVVERGSYQLPQSPGYSSEMKAEAVEAHTYPTGSVWVNRVASQ